MEQPADPEASRKTAEVKQLKEEEQRQAQTTADAEAKRKAAAAEQQQIRPEMIFQAKFCGPNGRDRRNQLVRHGILAFIVPSEKGRGDHEKNRFPPLVERWCGRLLPQSEDGTSLEKSMVYESRSGPIGVARRKRGRKFHGSRPF